MNNDWKLIPHARAQGDALMQNSIDIAEKAEALYESRITNSEPVASNCGIKEPKSPTSDTETIRKIKARRVQSFFRRAVSQSYNNRCAISGLAIPQLLVASHIIPWAEDVSRRAYPTNRIASNALYDTTFDRHLISFDEDFRLVLSPKLKMRSQDEVVRKYFLKIEGKPLEIPYRFRPNNDAMKTHFELCFN